ncbi:uridine kinase [Pseudoroseicyclus sp. CXY001]|uniref:uridine kinase family protein n=1 Tax=Pseudoroseicyclus sp. CXY001 TaxID=3242492 RepID=UPI003570D2B5
MTLVDRLRALPRPLRIAVDGRSGVGKSTFAGLLAADLGARLVEGDAFYAGGTEQRADPPEALAAACIDWRRQQAVLEALSAGRAASFRPFDWAAFDGSSGPEVLLPPAEVILLEGVYSARPELADLIDVAILLTSPEELRMARLLAREGEISPWERQWHRAEDWYFAHQAPPERFDVVVEVGDGADRLGVGL